MQTNRNQPRPVICRLLCVTALLVLGVAPQALAQSGGIYDLSWNTTDGGGSTSATGGAYSLGGTIGQPDAGASSGGAYALTGGFWGIANVIPTPTPSPNPTATPTATPTTTPTATPTATPAATPTPTPRTNLGNLSTRL